MHIERMLTIKRVPTVVSNHQENASSEDLESKARGCGRNCLGKCCLPVSKLPLYTFKTAENETAEKDVDTFCDRGHPISFLNNLLLGEWEDHMSRGLFRYDVTACETKVIPGRHGFVAQLNEGRHLKKRPTEFRVDQVLQAFDENKFNFTKVGQEEVLFMFEPSNDNEVHYKPSLSVNAASACSSPNVVAINVSPIEYGHVLLIPRVLDLLPQRIDHESFLLALHFARETADPAFRVGYNSLGAFATINHLHFQAYYLSVPLPIEKAPTCRLMTGRGTNDAPVIVSKLLNYPVLGLVFEGRGTLHNLSDAVADSCVFLQNNNIPFNVLMADCGRRIFLLPQCYAEKQALGEVAQELLDAQVNPAVWEISGHMVLKRRKDYNEASEQYARRLLSEVSLSEERFQEVTKSIAEAAGFQLGVDDISAKHETNQESNAPRQRAASHLPKDWLVPY